MNRPEALIIGAGPAGSVAALTLARAGVRVRLIDRASFPRTALLGVQATLAVVLVAGSTMLGRSLGNLEGQDIGFNRDGRVLVSMGRPSASFTGARLTALYRDVDAAAWARLDAFEGPEYERADIVVTLADGATLPAQAYRFRAEFLPRLLPGDWDADAFGREGRARFMARYVGFDLLKPR